MLLPVLFFLKGSERVRARILDIKINLRQPWLLCVLLIAVTPLFPEYISPFLAVGALIAAHFDAKARRRDSWWAAWASCCCYTSSIWP